MRKEIIGTYIYWDDGQPIGRKRITLRDENEGVIIHDGRVVKKTNGKWTYKAE